MQIASERELNEAVEVLGSAGLGDDAGEEETGDGMGESISLGVDELLTLLVDVQMLCTTIILRQVLGKRLAKGRETDSARSL